MIDKNILSRNRKKERIKIACLDDFKAALKREGYAVNIDDDEKLKEDVKNVFDLNSEIVNSIYSNLAENETIYKVDNVTDFIDYIEKINMFEKQHNNLCSKIRPIKKLTIERLEFDRDQRFNRIIDDCNKDKKVKSDDYRYEMLNQEEESRLAELEKAIQEEYVFAKDIELLKSIITFKNENVKENYDEETNIKSISIEIPQKVTYGYIKSKKGSVEYHEYLNKNMPRMHRLIKNLHQYLEICEKGEGIFNINQSKTLQDSINIAVAVYDGREFKAISGSCEIKDYCQSPAVETAVFKSYKVNRLGQLGVGYNRINDSEKKILEEIHRQIEAKILKDEGTLILYSKWEPCPSCYLVIDQFCTHHPHITLKVKYIKRYAP